MSISCNSLIPSKLFSPTKPSSNSTNFSFNHQIHHPVSPHYIINKRREFPVPAVASITYQPINVDYLQEEFNGHGVTFEGIGNSCIVKMQLDNGGTAIMMLPSGLITSYKPPMWHGGTLELLHSSVSEDENGDDAVIQGGVSLAFNLHGDGEMDSWCPTNWTLHDIRGNTRESIQVEMMSRNVENKVEVKYMVSLEEDMLSSELTISNSKSTTLKLTGSVLTHLTVSTPEATYAIGLEGSDFFTRTPFPSDFGIIPPDFGNQKGSINGFGEALKGFFSRRGQRNQYDEEMEMEGEEDDNYKQLNEQISRIYTSAPRNFTIIDRGSRNSVVVGREGFEEVYMFSPGSSHEFYGEYAFICVGQSAILKPILLEPQQVWRGRQHLYNPNL